MRYKSKDRFYDEIRYLVNDLGFREIDVVDDLVGAHRDRFFDMIDVLSEFKDSVKFDFSNGLHVGLHDEEMIDAYFDLGVRSLKFSVESGTEVSMKKMVKKGKGVDLVKARNLCKYIRTNGGSVELNFILGFPGETVELMEQTIDYIRSIEFDWAYIFCALPLPGTRIWKEFVRGGFIDEDTYDFDALRHGRRTFDTPEISAAKLEQLVYDANIDVNFFNNSNFQMGNYDKAIMKWNEMVNNAYPYHVVGRYCRGLANEKTNNLEVAEKDFMDCISWIRSNTDSKALYERYNNDMSKLESYF